MKGDCDSMDKRTHQLPEVYIIEELPVLRIEAHIAELWNKSHSIYMEAQICDYYLVFLHRLLFNHTKDKSKQPHSLILSERPTNDSSLIQWESSVLGATIITLLIKHE